MESAPRTESQLTSPQAESLRTEEVGSKIGNFFSKAILRDNFGPAWHDLDSLISARTPVNTRPEQVVCGGVDGFRPKGL